MGNHAQSPSGSAIALHNVLVMATKPAKSLLHAGQDWLLSCTRNPANVQRTWAASAQEATR
ncbi:hypothetical protein Scel_57190 [Streptomyces cellostaticus]|nr:hypothetical protein Scel_57190 [Streptomyces cellostaticus]